MISRTPFARAVTDVLRPQHFEHAGTNKAGDQTGDTRPERQRRQHERAQPDIARGGEPAQIDRENEDENQSDPEDRHGHTEQRDDHAGGVNPGAMADCRDDPQGHPDQERDGNRAPSEQDRLREGGERLLGDLALGEERPPEISPHRGEQEVPVLLGPGLVEPELLLQPRESAAEAPNSLSIISAGLPGVRCIRAKTMKETPMTTTTPWIRRWAMYASTGVP